MNKERILLEANIILEGKKTIRETAKIVGVSKSTVHVDVSRRLKKISEKLHKNIKKILLENFNDKHIRGGESTRIKYNNINKSIKIKKK